MERNTYNPNLIIKYDEFFKKYDPNYNIINEFFFVTKYLTLKIKDENYFDDRIQEVFQESNFENESEFDEYIEKFSEFTNFIRYFLESLRSTKSDKKIHKKIEKLYFAFLDLYDDEYKKIIPTITDQMSDVVNSIIKIYNIPMNQKLTEDEYHSELAARLGKNYAKLFTALLSLFYKLKNTTVRAYCNTPLRNAHEIDEHTIKTSFTLLIIIMFTVNLPVANEFSNQNISYNKSKSVGRNEPCPCSSGRKYKKCCLDKV